MKIFNGPLFFLCVLSALASIVSTVANDEAHADSFTPSQYSARAEELNLASQKQWRDMLHIRPNALGFSRSQITGPGFFLAADGFKNPKAELDATLAALHQPDVGFKPDEHPICRYPGRRRWLQEKLQIPESYFAKPDCPLYSGYLRRLKANSVSVVFSSYFSGNPGSAFGHTLFRISHEDANSDDSHNELLDYGIGFAADAPEDVNPILYALGGLFGGFQGTFSNQPYYYKVREYVSAESRDLWSYRLQLTPDEIALFVDHLWEIGGSSFSYYFFTQNCGLHILTTLDAAAPRLNLVSRVPLWVMPVDAIRALEDEPGLVQSVSYRPSLRSRVDYSLNQLNEPDQQRFIHYLKTQDLAELSGDPGLLDLDIDYFDFKHSDNERLHSPTLTNQRQTILIARAKLGVATPEPQVPLDPRKRPDLGHRSLRVDFDGGTDSLLGHFAQLDVRMALHDLLDPDAGYPPESKIEFMNFQARSYVDRSATSPAASASQSLQLQRFDFFNMESLTTWKSYDHPTSWLARIGSYRLTDFSCQDCLSYGSGFGIGASFLTPGVRDSFFSILAESEVLFSDQFTTGYVHATLGPSASWRIRLSNRASAFIKAQEKTLLGSNFQGLLNFNSEVRFHFTSWFSLGLAMEQTYFSSTTEQAALLKLYGFN